MSKLDFVGIALLIFVLGGLSSYFMGKIGNGIKFAVLTLVNWVEKPCGRRLRELETQKMETEIRQLKQVNARLNKGVHTLWEKTDILNESCEALTQLKKNAEYSCDAFKSTAQSTARELNDLKLVVEEYQTKNQSQKCIIEALLKKKKPTRIFDNLHKR